jgi:hypothetical protein
MPIPGSSILCKKGDSEMRPTNEWPPSMNMVAMIIGFAMFFMTISLPSFADTSWNVGISGGSHGIDGFSLSIGDYYQVPEREVAVIHERGIYEEELPVVFYIAQRAHVYPEDVVDLRLRGMSWMDITLHFGLSPEIYYVPVAVDRYGPPHGHAYGYYQNHPRGGWKRNDLRDRDIVNQVNLKFISEHHGYAPEKIMRYRSEGRSFNAIDHDISNEKHGQTRYQNRNDTHQKNYGQNPNRLTTTRQNPYTQDMNRPQYQQNNYRENQNTQNTPKPNEFRQNDYRQNQNRQNMPKQNVTRPNDYRQNQNMQNTTRENQQMRMVNKPNEYKENPYVPRQYQQQIQNAPKPNEFRQNDYKQNQNTQITMQNQSKHRDQAK